MSYKLYYKGFFKESMKHGEGEVFDQEDGSYYHGQFKNDIKEGIGFYQWKDKSEYYGEF